MKIIGKKYLEPYNNKRQTNITLRKTLRIWFWTSNEWFWCVPKEYE